MLIKTKLPVCRKLWHNSNGRIMCITHKLIHAVKWITTDLPFAIRPYQPFPAQPQHELNTDGEQDNGLFHQINGSTWTTSLKNSLLTKLNLATKENDWKTIAAQVPQPRCVLCLTDVPFLFCQWVVTLQEQLRHLLTWCPDHPLAGSTCNSTSWSVLRSLWDPKYCT